jgi:hypothetical protein
MVMAPRASRADDPRMRLKALLLALATAGCLASLGFGATPGNPQKPKPGHCGRFDVRGTLTLVGRSSFSLRRADGTAIVIAITRETEAFWTGKGTLRGPAVGESVWAKGQLCDGAYSATWVLVRPKTAQ